MLGTLAVVACVMETVSAGSKQSDVRFSGPALKWTKFGDVRVDAAECIGGCSIDGRCMEAATISVSTAETACSANKVMRGVAGIFGMIIVTAFFLVACYLIMFRHCITRCRKKMNTTGYEQP